MSETRGPWTIIYGIGGARHFAGRGGGGEFPGIGRCEAAGECLCWGVMKDWFERERLHRAAEAGDLGEVKTLLESGSPVNAFDELGKTPLHHAVLGEHFSVVDYLLRHGANVNAQDERVIGDTPLGEAASTCSLKMAQLLVAAGADPNTRGWMQLNAVDRAKERKRKEGIGSEGQAVFNFLKEAAQKRAT